MKKQGIVIVGSVLFLLLMLVLTAGACTASPPADTPPADTPPADTPPADTQTGEPAAEQEVFNIKFSTWHPPAGEECQHAWTPMLEELEKRSNGRITYTPYYGAALGAPSGTLRYHTGRAF
jgi:TRAP-type C4-dicarboxylate transport system substrate-binding protein